MVGLVIVWFYYIAAFASLSTVTTRTTKSAPGRWDQRCKAIAMSKVHYKFQSSNEHDAVTFDGLSISLADLKTAILAKSKLAQSPDFSIQITNAQTKEVYKVDSDLVPKNTSVTVTRVPLAKTLKGNDDGENMNEDSHLKFLAKRAESTISLAERENIQAMMAESTSDYRPADYVVRPRFAPRAGLPPASYVCKRCNKPGHFYVSCPLATGPMPANSRYPRAAGPVVRGHGIPVDFLEYAAPDAPGAFLSKYGYVVNKKDVEAYEEASKRKKPQAGQPLREFEIPAQFICQLCSEIMKDAVKTGCCATHFCDSCIREALLEDEDQSCPQCNEIESPDALVPDIIMRNAIATFLNKSSGFKRILKPKKPVDAASPAQTAANTASPGHSAPALVTTAANTPERSSTTTPVAASVATTCTAPTTSTSAVPTTVATDTSAPSTSTPPPAGDVTATANSSDSGEKPAVSEDAPVTPAITATSSVSLGDAAPGTVPVTIVPTASNTLVPGQPSLPSIPYNAATPYVAGAVYRPVVAAPGAASFTQFPPGMRPGLNPPYGTGVAVRYQPVIAPPGQPIMSEKEFYKTKAELLEKKINDKGRRRSKTLRQKSKSTDKVMDAFGEYLRPRNRSRSKTPRPRSRSRSRHRRSFSRSPVRRRSYSRSPPPVRRRSISPRPYYSPRRRSPGYPYPARSPPYHRDHHRRLPVDSYSKGDDYHRMSRRDDMYRDERYVDRYFYNGDRLSPYDRNLRYTPPVRGYSPDRRDYLPVDRAYSPRRADRGYSPRRDDRGYSPRRDDRGYSPRRDDRGYSPRRDDRGYSPRKDDRGYSPRRDDRAYDERDRRRYDEERIRYEDDRHRRYKEDDRRYADDDYDRRRREKDDDYSRKSGKYEDKPSHESKSSKHKESRHEDKDSSPPRNKAASKRGSPDDASGKGERMPDKEREEKSPVKEDGRDKKRKRKSRSPSPEKRIESSEDTKDEKEPTTKKAKETEEASKLVKQLTDGSDAEVKAKTSSKSKTSGDEKKKTKSSGKKKSSKVSSSEKKTSSKSSDKKKKRKTVKDGEKPGEKKSKLNSDADQETDTATKEVVRKELKNTISGTSQSTRRSSSQDSRTPPLEDLTGDDESTQPEDDVQMISAPKPSKWERDDSESDSKQTSPAVKEAKELAKPLSRKVLESADSMLRNKCVQPMASTEKGSGQKRKVFVEREVPSRSSRADDGYDSDASDGKSDLRKKIERLKERKHSSSDASSSEKKVDRSKSHGSLKSDSIKPSKSSSSLSSDRKSSAARSTDRKSERESSRKADMSKEKDSRESRKRSDSKRTVESKTSIKSDSRKADGEHSSRKRSRLDDDDRPSSSRSTHGSNDRPSSSRSNRETNDRPGSSRSSEKVDRSKSSHDIESANNGDAKASPRSESVTPGSEKKPKLAPQLSEENFEPDYDIDISEPHGSTHLADNDSQDADHSESPSASESGSDEKAKRRHKSKSLSKNKHKKSKKSRKSSSKHKKHKKSDR